MSRLGADGLLLTTAVLWGVTFVAQKYATATMPALAFVAARFAVSAAALAPFALWEFRRKPHAPQVVSLSAADPLNLIGIITPGARLASLAGNRLLYRDGVPIATYAADEVHFLEELPEKEEWEVRTALLRRHAPIELDESA